MARERDNRRHERDAWDRSGDEVRSWFGDDEARRRRDRDEADEGSRRDRYRDDRARYSDRDEYFRARDDREYDDDERRTWGEEMDESGLTRLDLTMGRGAGYGASGSADPLARRHERLPDDYDDSDVGEFPRRTQRSTPRFNLRADESFGRRSPFEEPLSDRHSYGIKGHMYGQHTGFGFTSDQYLGRWDETVRDTGHRGRGPRNYTRSDDRIGEDVADRLTDDPWIDASDVEVRVSEGTVTLSGTVPDRDTKYRAEEIAESVTGVRHVENGIRVRRAQS